MSLPSPGAVRVLRYVRVWWDSGAELRSLVKAGWTTDLRVVFPASGRRELATVLAWRDEPEGAE